MRNNCKFEVFLNDSNQQIMKLRSPFSSQHVHTVRSALTIPYNSLVFWKTSMILNSKCCALLFKGCQGNYFPAQPCHRSCWKRDVRICSAAAYENPWRDQRFRDCVRRILSIDWRCRLVTVRTCFNLILKGNQLTKRVYFWESLKRDP